MSEDAAVEAGLQKDELIAVLGHELRNPMSAISSAVAVLERIEIDNPKAKRPMEIIRRQLNQLVRLMNDLSESSHLLFGKMELVQEPIELGDTIRRVLRTFEHSGLTRFHSIEVATEPAWVYVDPARLDQVMSNLLGNALKFTPEHGKIRISVAADNDRATLTMSDSGVGIPKEFLPRVFQPFAQAKPEFSGKSGSLGLSLSLVKRLVQMHGGEVGVSSDGPGKGCTFVVSLLLISKTKASGAAQPAAEPTAGLRVILIEDNDDVRETVGELLQITGHIVESASDGPEGLERALKTLPQVALVDLALPTWDGYEVARRLRNQFGRAIRIIAMSGFGRELDRTTALGAGFDAFLIKPVDPKELLEALRLSEP
jgi:CheY-like chemotaxis protein/two-component sensor histidine kinase